MKYVEKLSSNLCIKSKVDFDSIIIDLRKDDFSMKKVNSNSVRVSLEKADFGSNMTNIG